MLGLSSAIRGAARSGTFSTAATTSIAQRALSTTATESLKVDSAAAPPPLAAQKEERIKYFKIYRWDPDHRQKPVSLVHHIFFCMCRLPNELTLTHTHQIQMRFEIPFIML